MQNVRRGDPQCVSWILILKVHTHYWHSHAVSLTHNSKKKTSILHLANSAALCYTERTTEGCVTAEVNGNVVTCNVTNFALLVNSSEFIFISHINKLVPHFPSISFITSTHIFYLTMSAAPGCDAETTEFLSWPDTPAGTTQFLRCPNTTTTISRTWCVGECGLLSLYPFQLHQCCECQCGY